MEQNETIIVESQGKRYRIDGALNQLIKEHIAMKAGDGTEGLENQAFDGITIYAVAIDRVEDANVEEFTSMASSMDGKLYLLAINPGKRERNAAMDALERKAESLDVPIHHDAAFLLDGLVLDNQAFQIVGPMAQIIEQAQLKLSQSRQSDGGDDDSADDIDAQDIEPGMESWSAMWDKVWGKDPYIPDEEVEQWAERHIGPSGRLKPNYTLKESISVKSNALHSLGIDADQDVGMFADRAIADLALYGTIVKDGMRANRSVTRDIERLNTELAKLDRDTEHAQYVETFSRVLDTLAPAYYTVFQEPKTISLKPKRMFAPAPSFVKTSGPKLTIRGKMPLARVIGFQKDPEITGRGSLVTAAVDQACVNAWLDVRNQANRLINEVEALGSKLVYLDVELVSPERLVQLEHDAVTKPYLTSLTDPWLLVKYFGFLAIVGQRARLIKNAATRLVYGAVTVD